MNLGQLIRQQRIRLGLTQEELGKRLGVSKMAISKYENNKTDRLSRETAMKLSTILDIPIIKFIKDSDTEEITRDDFIKELELILSNKELTDEKKKKILDILKIMTEE